MERNSDEIDWKSTTPLVGGGVMIIIVFIILYIFQIWATETFYPWRIIKVLLLVILALNVISATEVFFDPKLLTYPTYSGYESNCKKFINKRFSLLFLKSIAFLTFYITEPGRYFGYWIVSSIERKI